MTMTRQQIFNTAYHGLAAQGFEQSFRIDEGGNHRCLYRGDGGRRCALGYCIPNSIYQSSFDEDNKTAAQIWRDAESIKLLFAEEDLEFLRDLQMIHDGCSTPSRMHWRLICFAEAENLTIPELPVKAEAPQHLEAALDAPELCDA